MNYGELRQEDRKRDKDDKKTEKELEGMVKGQNDWKTENPCHEAWLVQMNDVINRDLKLNWNK